MLVLTRKEDESIDVGEEIKIRVLSTHSGRVRLGIDCPRDVSIRRSELAEGSGEPGE